MRDSSLIGVSECISFQDLSFFLPSFFLFINFFSRVSIFPRIEDIWLREFFKLVGEQLCDENDINLITSLSDCA